MVVVSIKAPDGSKRRVRFERSFTIGTEPTCDCVLAGPPDAVVTIAIADPDVRIEHTTDPSLRLNEYDVDTEFVHVLHVGDKLMFADHEILFELVAGTAVEVGRVFGEVSTLPDAAEQEILAALRADPADPMAREVYADWLDSHERCNEAELVRLQWLPEGKQVHDPAAFSSEWMSHQTRAVQLRLRDLAQLTDRARRALASRPTMLCPVRQCARRWEQLAIRDDDTVRYCGRCERTVEFCSTFDRLASRGELGLPVAVDPILVSDVATRAYRNPEADWDPPTDPFLELEEIE